MANSGWPRAPTFLVHVRPLAKLFRAKFRAALRRTDLFQQVLDQTWRQAWVGPLPRGGRWASRFEVSGPLHLSGGH